MPSILGYTVTSWPKGRLAEATQRIGVIDPLPGYDGLAVVKSGWTCVPSDIVTYTTVATGLTDQLEETYRRLHGQIGTVVDSRGKTWSNVTVLGVTTVPWATAITAVSSVEARWRLLPQVRRPS